VCLGEQGPLRYSELGNGITGWTGTRIGDGEITRTVTRLLESGLAQEAFVDGHRSLTLTDAGRHRLEMIRALGRALRDFEQDDQGGPSQKPS
ncbi:LysR family transcriptional regulator, partial [Micromonospora qiuiae]|uniref:LysR family transcriptional regulator n=1 Tax=Micromonospora qiuiae TaxID=502268 RepID=UPI001950175A